MFTLHSDQREIGKLGHFDKQKKFCLSDVLYLEIKFEKVLKSLDKILRNRQSECIAY